jgi:hypothetical protein
MSDMGPIDRFEGGGAISPRLPHESIRLDSQEVTIRLRKDTYAVDVVFRFFNTGETITEWVGFPERRMVALLPYTKSAFLRFETLIDGRTAEFSREQDLTQDTGLFLRWLFSSPSTHEDRRWLVHYPTFPGHARTTVRVGYEARYNYHHGNCFAGSYIYGTGGYWKDNIGKAVFVIDSSNLCKRKIVDIKFPRDIRPLQKSENMVIYELKDFDPNPEEKLDIVTWR